MPVPSFMAMLRRGYISKKSYHFLASAGRFAQLFGTMLSYDSLAAYIVHCAVESRERPISPMS
jgi:hypothetical protein